MRNNMYSHEYIKPGMAGLINSSNDKLRIFAKNEVINLQIGLVYDLS